jgi:hypothetical protein
VIGHVAMQQCTGGSDVIVSDMADCGHRSVHSPFSAEGFNGWTFIQDTIERANVRTSSTFGFFGPEPQRRGGWGQGPFQSSIEREIYAELYHFFGDKTMGSGLIANEGDAAVAVLSFFSVVLTNERPTKNGPLRFAYENGGKVLFLRLFPEAARNLRQHFLACYDEDPDLANHSQH